MPVASFCVHCAPPISGARFRLTVFDHDHDLLGRSERAIRHPERPETK